MAQSNVVSEIEVPEAAVVPQMGVQFSRKELLAAAETCALVTPLKSSTKPILKCMLIEAEATGDARAKATDLCTSVTVDLSALVVSVPGAVTVDALVLARVLKTSKAETVEIGTLPSGAVTVDLGTGRTVLFALPADSYPAIPTHKDFELTPVFSDVVSAIRLEGDLAWTIGAISTDDARSFCGLLMESTEHTGEVRLVATDGHRLHLAGIRDGGVKIGQIPRTAAVAVYKTLSAMRRRKDLPQGVGILSRCGNIWFDIGKVHFTAKILDKSFPDWKRVTSTQRLSKGRVVENNEMAVQMDATEAKAVFSAAKRAIGKGLPGVKMKMVGSDLEVSTSNTNTGDYRATLTVSGVLPQEIGINPEYIIDVLKLCEGSYMSMLVGGELDPILLRRAEYIDRTAIVMPWRLSK